MNHNHQNHLTYDEQLKAMVDVSDLPDDRQYHLHACDACQGEADRLEQRFVSLGKTAADLAPKPRRPFRLPGGASKSTRWRFGTMWATGAVAVLLLMTLVWWPEQFDPDRAPGSMAGLELVDDRRLMAEIDGLIENALPERYRQLAVVAEPRLNLDEDLINWIVPSIEEDDSLT